MQKIAKCLAFSLFLAWLHSIAVAQWFAPRPEPLWPRPPSTLPCVYALDMRKAGLPERGPFALLAVDYDGYAQGDTLTRNVYDAYFQTLHAHLASMLPVYVLLSAQEPVVWKEGTELKVVEKKVRVPCGTVDDPENARDYAYMPGLYLFRDGAFKLLHFNFPFIEMGRSEVAALVLRDVARFTRGQRPVIRPLPLLSKERVQPPPNDLPLPAFLLRLSGMEWAAPANERPLKRPRIVRDKNGSIRVYQEFPSGHLGARGRYLLEKLGPYLKKAGVAPVGLIPPDGIVSKEAVGTLAKMREAFPGWTFIQLDPPKAIRFREAIRPCLIREDGQVRCFILYVTRPPFGRFLPLDAFPSFLRKEKDR